MYRAKHVLAVERWVNALRLPHTPSTHGSTLAAALLCLLHLAICLLHPPSRQQHQGLTLYDQVFDGRFQKALQSNGAIIDNMLDCTIFHHPASGQQPWLRGMPAQAIPAVFCSRHVFETTARQLLADNPRVRFVYGASVSGLVFEEQQEQDSGSNGNAGPHKAVTGAVFEKVVARGILAACCMHVACQSVSLHACAALSWHEWHRRCSGTAQQGLLPVTTTHLR